MSSKHERCRRLERKRASKRADVPRAERIVNLLAKGYTLKYGEPMPDATRREWMANLSTAKGLSDFAHEVEAAYGQQTGTNAKA